MAGNHDNCCFVIILENAVEYVLFRSEIFSFCLILNGLFISQSKIATQNWSTTAQSDAGRLGPSYYGNILELNFKGHKLRWKHML